MPLTKEEKEFVEAYFKELKRRLYEKIAEMVAKWIKDHLEELMGEQNAISK